MKSKHLLLAILTAFIYTTPFAQLTISKQWATGPADDSYRGTSISMSLTKDKGWIIGNTSYENALCQKTQNNRDVSQSTADYWIVKYKSSGAIQWNKTIGGSKDDQLVGVEQTSDSGYIAGGYSNSSKSGEKTQNSRGGTDYWIVKLDKAGNIQWSKTYGGDSTDNLSSIHQTSDGGYIMGGYSYSGISGEKTAGGTGYWIVKVDKDGKVQWNKILNTGNEIKQTRDGGYIIVFATGLTKLDNKGNVLWSSIIAPPSTNNIYRKNLSHVDQTAEGGYITGGYIGSSNPSIEEGTYYWIIKADSVGKRQWSRRYGNAEYAYNYVSSVQQTKDYGYVIGAYSNSPGTEDNYDFNYVVMKLDTGGDIQWSNYFQGDGDDEYTIAREISKDHYLVAGYSESGIGGDKTVHACGNTADIWIFKLIYSQPQTVQTTSLNDADRIAIINRSNTFSVYPNPARDIVQVQTKGTTTVSLTDGAGKVLLTKVITNNSSINVSNLKAGMYYLCNNTTGETRKVIIIR